MNLFETGREVVLLFKFDLSAPLGAVERGVLVGILPQILKADNTCLIYFMCKWHRMTSSIVFVFNHLCSEFLVEG